MKINKELLARIQSVFFTKLQAKTGWGRNELMQVYKDSVTEVIMELMDKED